ncbi:unnamed protein product, partial [Laminaria digitata]
GIATAEASSLQPPSPSPLGESSCRGRGSAGSVGQARLEPAAWRDYQAVAVDAERGSGGGGSGDRSSIRRGQYSGGAADVRLDGGWDGVEGAVGLEMSIVGDRSSGMRSRTPGRERRAHKSTRGREGTRET